LKIVVIGGSGLIGSKVVRRLGEQGHDAVAASPRSGVNTITGEGLAAALTGAQVVVDVSNAPNWDDAPVMAFFQTSARNLLAAETAAGVGHHVVLSVVGTERLQEMGYFRAKLAQEAAVQAAAVPYTILRATQFFEFISSIADAGTDGTTVYLPPVLFQPVAAADVAAALADIAVCAPVNGAVELAGPESFRLDDLVRRVLRASDDPRQVTADARARFYGVIRVEDHSLIPGDHPRLGPTRLGDWLSQARAR
jgi:uncharacterized protein YbjT (DUF2867 family)